MDVKFFLDEDIKERDITSELLLKEETAKARIIAREDCVLAGLEEAMEIFKFLELEASSSTSDGEEISKGDVVLEISGKAKSILAGERLALNFLSRMSGIASETRRLVKICQDINPDIKIAATRKTTPGFRFFEKKAVALGGGYPHRYGLDDAVLIKDNHLMFVSSVEEAVRRAKSGYGGQIEIEVENLDDALKAAHSGADIIMLDNMGMSEVKKAYNEIKKVNSTIIIEISGGITPDNILEYARHSDMISLGYLTHSIKSKDFSLEIVL